MKSIKVVKKSVRLFIYENRQRYLLATMIMFVGITIGVIASVGERSNYSIFTTENLSLYNIITNDYAKFELFFDDFFKLMLSIVIIFIFSIKKFTFFLNFIYIGFQGFLFGASVSGLIADKGLSGIINAVFFVLPINIINFMAIISALVVCWQRLIFSTKYKLSLGKSLKPYTIKFMAIILLCIISASIYGIIYPILLRSVVVVNY